MPTTGFGPDDWNRVMAHGWFLAELLKKHIAIMDKHDPTRRMGLVVDEWGAWYENDSGRPANELFQQQTIRDAVLAALTLNLFIAHAERVSMANIAQVINVLHAMILTYGEKMVCTPSWHVFGMYLPHQDAARLPITGEPAMRSHEDGSYPRVSATASRAADNSITVTLAHTDPAKPVTVELTLTGLPSEALAKGGRILTAPALTDLNTPEAPNRVAAKPWTDFRFDGSKLTASLPPGCVAAISFAK
jgi:alpha-N-arabinofuranosidase